MRTTPIVLLGFLALGACGVKSPPQPPHPDSFPHQYPAPESAPDSESHPALNAEPPTAETDTAGQHMYQ
jgi:hypothetical protein